MRVGPSVVLYLLLACSIWSTSCSKSETVTLYARKMDGVGFIDVSSHVGLILEATKGEPEQLAEAISDDIRRGSITLVLASEMTSGFILSPFPTSDGASLVHVGKRLLYPIDRAIYEQFSALMADATPGRLFSGKTKSLSAYTDSPDGYQAWIEVYRSESGQDAVVLVNNMYDKNTVGEHGLVLVGDGIWHSLLRTDNTMDSLAASVEEYILTPSHGFTDQLLINSMTASGSVSLVDVKTGRRIMSEVVEVD